MIPLKMKTSSDPTILSGGLFYVDFGEYQRINSAIVQIPVGVVTSGIGSVSGYVVTATPTIVSNNQVRVGVTKRAVGDNSIVVGTSGDMMSSVVTVLAYGE